MSFITLSFRTSARRAPFISARIPKQSFRSSFRKYSTEAPPQNRQTPASTRPLVSRSWEVSAITRTRPQTLLPPQSSRVLSLLSLLLNSPRQRQTIKR